jgi:UDP-glucose 4-epimerase
MNWSRATDGAAANLLEARVGNHSPSPTGPVLIIGAGFIGSAVARALSIRDAPVTLVTRSSQQVYDDAFASANRVPVEHMTRSRLAELIAQHRHIVLASGGASPAGTESQVAGLYTELQWLELILCALRTNGGTGLTYLSSGGTVYGNAKLVPTPETASAVPIGQYGLAKMVGEHYIRAAHADYGLRACILRIGNAYGPGQPTAGIQGVIGTAFRAALTGEPMVLVDKGRAIRDFVYIADVAVAIIETATSLQGIDVYNVGSGSGTKISMVVEMIESMTARRILTVPTPARRFDVRASVLSVAKLQERIGFTPKSLEDGLALTWSQVRRGLVRA